MTFSYFHVRHVAISNIAGIVIIKHAKSGIFRRHTATSGLIRAANFRRTGTHVAFLARLHYRAVNVWYSLDNAFSGTKLGIVGCWKDNPIPANVVEVDFEIVETAQIAACSLGASA